MKISIFCSVYVQPHMKRTPDMNAPNPCLSTRYFTSLKVQNIRKTQQGMLIIVLLSLTFSFHSCILASNASISHSFLNRPCVRRTSSSLLSSFLILTVLAVFLNASKFEKKSRTLKRFEFERSLKIRQGLFCIRLTATLNFLNYVLHPNHVAISLCAHMNHL